MYVLCGKTCSGKDKVINELVDKYGYKKLVAYTTRPKREKEISDVTYHYVSDEDFKQKAKDGFFAEWKSYITEFGVWYYGTAKKDYDNSDNLVAILSPSSYQDVCENLCYEPKCVYLYANNQTIRKRLLKRGDSKDEAERRISQDNQDFKGFELVAHKIVHNEFDDDISVVVEKIHNIFQK